MPNEILSAVIGLRGALFGAALASWTGVAANRWSRTTELHRELDSDRVRESRSAPSHGAGAAAAPDAACPAARALGVRRPRSLAPV